MAFFISYKAHDAVERRLLKAEGNYWCPISVKEYSYYSDAISGQSNSKDILFSFKYVNIMLLSCSAGICALYLIVDL